MTKLNQIVAIEKGVKAESDAAFTKAYHTIQQTPLLSGISRTYRPRDDEGEHLPPESTLVQVRVGEVMGGVAASLARMFDVMLTKDVGNTTAKADIVVDGVTVAVQIPCTFLLTLEKRLTDIGTFVNKLPTLDQGERWTYNEEANCYATEPKGSTRSKKVPRNHVKAEATDRHPAQVDVYYEDIIVGDWTTVKFSGAISAKRKAELQSRVSKLKEAVKSAREEANSTTVTDVHIGEGLFGYLFG